MKINKETDYLRSFDDDGNTLNPLIWADVPDPDVIRVNNTYYMTSTTMYFTPGIPVMKSHDLINWELVNYVYDILDDSDTNALRNGTDAYGKGSWASSLRYNNGVFYVVAAALNTQKTYIFQTTDIENGAWNRYEIEGYYHDSSLLFDDDGRVYLVYGGGTIRLIEINADATAIKESGLNRVLIKDVNLIFGYGADNGLPGEGSHFYKIDGRYYLFLIAWPKTGTKRRVQLCYRADKIEGPYEGKIVLDDDMGNKDRGIAQGGLVESSSEAKYAMLFQDHGAVGRIPILVPVTWEDGWPVFGENGCVPQKLHKLINKQDKDNVLKPSNKTTSPIVCSDEFDAHTNSGSRLALPWQWNHNPDNSLWSLSDRPGFLRFKTAYINKGLADARNTLTQRTFGPLCSATVALETGAMKDGDTAGLAALQELHGYVGIKVISGEKQIIMYSSADTETQESIRESTPITQERVYLRVNFSFDRGIYSRSPDDNIDYACFYYSLDERNWHKIGNILNLEYRLSHFTGYRFALFYYATKETGGYVDFDYFRLDDNSCLHL